MLTRLLLEGHNVLLLDEPTNHLDIQSAEAVTLALSAYPGTVLAISHDRYFLDEVADRVLWLEGGEWRVTRGGYAEAEAERDARARDRESARDRDRDKAPGQPRRAEAQRPAAAGQYAGWRTGKLENRIIQNEERMAAIHSAFADPAVIRDGNRMRLLQTELATIEEEQSALEAEYARRG